MLSEISIQIKGNTYTVAYPNVGEYYRIEAMKQVLGKGFYNTLAQTPTNSANHALDMIDIEATLTILCPKLIENLKVKSFQDLGISDYKEIRKVYSDEIYPFIKKINDLLGEVDTPATEK